ncbi:MAG: hypothetical protein GY870_05735, partial [archaeon]|nr:hypothetical protein [archaeon]
MSITQKILANHQNQREIDQKSSIDSDIPEPGEFINVDLDLIMVHEQ